MKPLRRPRWLFRLIGHALCRWRGYWWSRCVNCGQEFGAWEWSMDGYPTTGEPCWHYEEFAICRECATATPEELREMGCWLSVALPEEYARRQREQWMRRRLAGEKQQCLKS